jgi:hypothetical protein
VQESSVDQISTSGKQVKNMDEVFNFKKDLLKWELDKIAETIGRVDGITNNIKNWAVITWGAASHSYYKQQISER